MESAKPVHPTEGQPVSSDNAARRTATHLGGVLNRARTAGGGSAWDLAWPLGLKRLRTMAASFDWVPIRGREIHGCEIHGCEIHGRYMYGREMNEPRVGLSVKWGRLSVGRGPRTRHDARFGCLRTGDPRCASESSPERLP